jgi:Ni,Fe-hydrogenase III small subunit
VRNFFRARIKQGTPTIQLGAADAGLPERFRGRPSLDASRCDHNDGQCLTRIPSAVVKKSQRGLPVVDVGACLFSPDEGAACEQGALSFTRDYRMASRTRDGLVSPTGEVELASALERRMQSLFGRSLRLRSMVAGSCGGCEGELVALSNVVFDAARFGVQFVASPRHADGILITGAVSVNMRAALQRTYAAVPAPRLVIAVGACAVSGGPFRGSPEVSGGVPPELPVDLWIPGCPPHPLTVLDGLLRLLGRLPRESEGGR